jgi:hypothetical protein
MARGSLDFSNVVNSGISFSVAPSWEAINRPLGLLSKDLRGQCLLYNDFEDGSPSASETFTNVPVYQGIAVNNIYPGNFSYRMKTNVGANSLCALTFGLPYALADRCGHEALYYCNDSVTVIRHKLNYFSGSVVHESAVRFDTNDGKTYLLNNVGVYVDISSLVTHTFPDTHYQNIKLVVDFTTGKYLRVLINSVLYDISAYSYKQSASVVKSYLQYENRVNNFGANSAEIFVDNIIITGNEP